MDEARRLARNGSQAFLGRIQAWQGAEQASRIGMTGQAEQTITGCLLHHLSGIHHDNLIRNSGDPVIHQALTDVFIMPPDLDELRRRLRKRGTESEEQINRRLETAAREMELWRDYRYTIITGSVEEDLTKFRAIMRAERYLSRRLTLAT